MKRSLIFLSALVLPISLSPGCAHETTLPTAQSAADELLSVDRVFANVAGTGVGRLEGMFAPDVVMMGVPEPGFATTPAEAVARIGKIIGAASQDGRVTWWPVRGGVSADGQQGFTFGYLTVAQNEKAAFQAKYVSYWIKGADGWRVKLYKFVPREMADIPTASFPPVVPAVAVAPGVPNSDAAASLAAVEKAFSDDSQTTSLRINFKKLGRPDSVHSLAGNDFVVGSEAIGEAHPDGPSPLRWKADQVVMASSGDLGATYGYLERNGPTPPGRLARIPFFTVWHRESAQAPWRYVIE